VQARGGGERPGIAAEGPAALETGLDALDFLFGERLIDLCEPVARNFERPLRKNWLKLRIADGPNVEAAVGPRLSLVHQVGGERISLDVAEECQEMLVALDGKGFEAILVEMAVADGVMSGSPADGVGVG